MNAGARKQVIFSNKRNEMYKYVLTITIDKIYFHVGTPLVLWDIVTLSMAMEKIRKNISSVHILWIVVSSDKRENLISLKVRF